MSEPIPRSEDPGREAIKAGMPPEPMPVAREPIAYQPVSGWAIAGFAAGALFAVMVALSTVVALSQGAPMFFPIWTVALAVVGVVLSLLGQRHVQSSEGTRAGAKLARLGLWLSLISGVSYFSYYFVTGLALQSQANAFIMEKSDDDSGFFPRLQAGATDPIQLNAAFLLTLPTTQRGGRPDNEDSMIKLYDTPNKEGDPGTLSQFKYGTPPSFLGSLPRIFFKQSAKDVEVIPMGVQEWSYEQKSYRVRRNYRIKSKEIEWEITLVASSTEAESAGQGRKWYLNLSQSGLVSKESTKFGDGIAWLRMYAQKEFEGWIAKLNAGEAFPGIQELDKTEWDKKAGAAEKEQRLLLHKLFASDAKARIPQFKIYVGANEVGKWEEVEGGTIRIHQGFRIGLPKTLGQAPAFNVDGYAVFETVQSIKPAEFSGDSARPTWRLVQIGFTRINPVPETKGMGPGG